MVVTLRTTDIKQCLAVELRAQASLQTFLADVRGGVGQVVLTSIRKSGSRDESALPFRFVAIGAFVVDGRMFLAG